MQSLHLYLENVQFLILFLKIDKEAVLLISLGTISQKIDKEAVLLISLGTISQKIDKEAALLISLGTISQILVPICLTVCNPVLTRLWDVGV